jgi:hypothetical protein
VRGERAPGGPLDLAAGRDLLLRDFDGDGFPDALAGPVWIADGGGAADVDAGVAAAAEFLARLAARALTLPVDVRRWPRPRPGVYLGRGAPPDGHEGAAGTATVARVGDGVLLSAPDPAGLRRAVGAWLDAAPADGADAPDAPPPGGFAPGGGVPESLGVALRHALASVRAPTPLTVPFADAVVRTALDPALPAGTWAVRRRAHSSAGTALEVVGHDRDALASACRWYAASYPRLPDGVWLDALDAAATRFVRAERRDGRLAAVAAAAAAARAEGDPPVAAELPYPSADAPLRLGLPVANSARDGALRRWSWRAPWEGERLLVAAAAALARRSTVPRSPLARRSTVPRSPLARRPTVPPRRASRPTCRRASPCANAWPPRCGGRRRRPGTPGPRSGSATPTGLRCTGCSRRCCRPCPTAPPTCASCRAGRCPAAPWSGAGCASSTRWPS